MSTRYQIWDKTSTVITPSSEMFTPEQWIGRYPWINIPGTVPVIAAGMFNGGFIGELGEMKRMYESQGADFSECTTDQEVLDKIEEFETNPNPDAVAYISPEERIASALEAQVMMSLPDDETVNETTAEDGTTETTGDSVAAE